MRGAKYALICLSVLRCVSAAYRDSQCDFRDGQVTCVCNGGETMTLFEIPHDTVSLTISNCRKVSFGGTPFKGLHLNRLEVVNSSSVKLQESTFLGVKKIALVELVNLVNLEIKSLYFLRADKVELRNVTIDTLQRYAILGDVPIKVLRISNSAIGTLANGSLHFGNDTSLEITDCKIGLIEGNGLTVENVSNFTLRRSELTLEEEALNLINISKVLIDRNDIHTTTVASFLAFNIREFRMSNNYFRHVGVQTFYHMGEVEKVLVEKNRFLRVDEGGLDFHRGAGKTSFTVRDNRFFCDCDLFWLWRGTKQTRTEVENSTVERFLNSSLCDRPDSLADLPLLEVLPFVRRETDECIRMEPINRVEDNRVMRQSAMITSIFKSASAPSEAAMSAPILATLFFASHAVHL